jgi:predicted HicB family RNase H-like nuclease
MKTYPMVSFRCDDKLRRSLEQEAKRQGISIGQLIRQAVNQELNKPKP